MNKKSNVIKKFFYSIYDVDSFRNFIKEGLTRAIVYALFLSIIVGGARGFIQTIKFNNYLESTIDYLKDDKYQFTIENNKLDIQTSPIKVRKSEISIYVDKDVTLNDVESIESDISNEGAYLIILQDGVVAKSGLGDEISASRLEFKYSEMNSNYITNNNSAIQYLDSIRWTTIGVIISLMIMKDFIFCITLSVIIAFLTMIPSRLLKSNLAVKELISLSIYAFTLPNILVLILNIIIPDVNFDTAIMIGTLAYTYLLIRHIKIQNEDDIKL
ncbi:MAG: DUF1189 domain-containing protein [Clostridium sp.]|nr:DUF1189 domain-containing protein [Clostridium sp.]